MVIFNSYVSLPEGTHILSTTIHCRWHCQSPCLRIPPGPSRRARRTPDLPASPKSDRVPKRKDHEDLWNIMEKIWETLDDLNIIYIYIFNSVGLILGVCPDLWVMICYSQAWEANDLKKDPSYEPSHMIPQKCGHHWRIITVSMQWASAPR